MGFGAQTNVAAIQKCHPPRMAGMSPIAQTAARHCTPQTINTAGTGVGWRQRMLNVPDAGPRALLKDIHGKF
jgi:hypothetical protein